MVHIPKPRKCDLSISHLIVIFAVFNIATTAIVIIVVNLVILVRAALSFMLVILPLSFHGSLSSQLFHHLTLLDSVASGMLSLFLLSFQPFFPNLLVILFFQPALFLHLNKKGKQKSC